MKHRDQRHGSDLLLQWWMYTDSTRDQSVFNKVNVINISGWTTVNQKCKCSGHFICFWSFEIEHALIRSLTANTVYYYVLVIFYPYAKMTPYWTELYSQLCIKRFPLMSVNVLYGSLWRGMWVWICCCRFRQDSDGVSASPAWPNTEGQEQFSQFQIV